MIDESAEPTERTFKIGDMQEHRYPYAKAWKANGWSHDDTKHIEDIHGLIFNHYEPTTGRFKSPYELAWEHDMAEEAALEANKNKPAFKVPDSVINDWTGQKFVDNMPCYGNSPCPKEVSLLQMKADPFDPELSDV